MILNSGEDKPYDVGLRDSKPTVTVPAGAAKEALTQRAVLAGHRVPFECVEVANVVSARAAPWRDRPQQALPAGCRRHHLLLRHSRSASA